MTDVEVVVVALAGVVVGAAVALPEAPPSRSVASWQRTG